MSRLVGASNRRPARHTALPASASDILALVGDGIIVTDESGRILLFNRAAEAIFGYEPGEVLGNPVEMLIPERFRDEHAKITSEFAAGGENAVRLMGRSREVAGLRKNGEEFPVEATLSRRLLGRTTTLTVAVRDISERKMLERQVEARTRALEESEKRLRLALRSAEMGTLGVGLRDRQPAFRWRCEAALGPAPRGRPDRRWRLQHGQSRGPAGPPGGFSPGN